MFVATSSIRQGVRETRIASGLRNPVLLGKLALTYDGTMRTGCAPDDAGSALRRSSAHSPPISLRAHSIHVFGDYNKLTRPGWAPSVILVLLVAPPC